MSLSSSILYAINNSDFIQEYIDIIEEDHIISGTFYCFIEDYDYARYLVCDSKVYSLNEIGEIEIY